MRKTTLLYPGIRIVFKRIPIFGATYNLQIRVKCLLFFHYWKQIDFTFPHIFDNDPVKAGAWLIKNSINDIRYFFKQDYLKYFELDKIKP